MRRTTQQANRWQQQYARVVRDDIRPEPAFVGTFEVNGRALQEGESVIFAPGYDPIIIGDDDD
jgi:hypothetical protein